MMVFVMFLAVFAVFAVKLRCVLCVSEPDRHGCPFATWFAFLRPEEPDTLNPTDERRMGGRFQRESR
jgi:hypothetical protein